MLKSRDWKGRTVRFFSRSPHLRVFAPAQVNKPAIKYCAQEFAEMEATQPAGTVQEPDAGARGDWPPPWLFVLMPLTYGVFAGYVQTALPWLLRHMGYPVDGIGTIVALILSPMAFYFVSSPLLDFGLRRRTWMLLVSALAGVLMAAAIFLLGSNMVLAKWLLFAGFDCSLLSSACGGTLVAVTQSEQGKAKAAAWLQGGALAAQALGGAVLLYCSKHLAVPVLAVVAALLVALPAVVALTIPEPPVRREFKKLRETCITMSREIRATLFSLKSLPGLLLLVSPVGTGAAQSLFAAMAQDYHVGLSGVLMLNGMLGAVLNMAGASVAIVAPAHWDRRICYAAAGLASACAGIFLSFAPLTPLIYFVGVAAYIFTAGICWGFFLGVVMVTMGEAGISAGSRYSILVSLGNLPIVYMTVVEARSYGVFGTRGVPGADAVGNLLAVVCVAYWLMVRMKRAGRGVEITGESYPAVAAAMEPAALE
jgi:MFS transporter, PAT family, beta-lactamase induction signal transducer AmpG